MRIFGLTLLVLLSFGVVHGSCPDLINSSGWNPDLYVVNSTQTISCNSDVFDLGDSSHPGTIKTLYIQGSVTINDSIFQIINSSPTTIVINSTGSLIFDNSSALRSTDAVTGNVTITVQEGGVLDVRGGSVLTHVDLLTLSTTSVLYNSTIRGSGPVSYEDSADVSFLTVDSLGESLRTDSGNYSFSASNFTGQVDIVDSTVSFTDSVIGDRIRAKDSIVSLYNSTFPTTDLDNATIFEYWPVEILILNELGFPLYGITVTAVDNTASQVYDDFTFIDGLLTPYLLGRSINNSEGSSDTNYTYYSNYTITAYEESGGVYVEENTSINVTTPLSINLTLDTLKGIVQTGDCTAGRPFCTNVNPYQGCTNMKAGDECSVQFVINGTNNFDGSSLSEPFYTFFLIGKGLFGSTSAFYSENVTLSFSEE